MEDERNTGQAVVPDGIPGSSANETETLEPATDAVPEDIPKELTKKEKRAQRKEERRVKRSARNGVSFLLVLLIIISINAFWLGFIRFHVVPDYGARIEEVLAEKDEAIKRIQAIYKVREEDFEKRLTACEEKQAALEEMYENAVKIIKKYGGDLSFLDDDKGEEENP